MYQDKAAIVAKVNELSDDEFMFVPEDGGWSVSQVINHIIISEFGTTRYMSKKLLGLPDLPSTGVKNNFNAKALKIALKSNKKFKAPKVLPDPNNDTKEITLNKWEKVRKGLMAILETMPPEATKKAIFKHPVAGYLNPEQTAGFLQTHVVHHTKQIDNLINAFKK